MTFFARLAKESTGDWDVIDPLNGIDFATINEHYFAPMTVA